MKYIFITFLVLSIFLLLGTSHPSSALMTSGTSSSPTTNIATTTGGCTSSQSCSDAQQGANVLNNGSSISIDKIIGTVISLLGWIIGTVSVFMVIFGGFRFVVSGGDSNAVSSARKTIFYALIGLVIAALAQVLVHYVLKSVFPTI